MKTPDLSYLVLVLLAAACGPSVGEPATGDGSGSGDGATTNKPDTQPSTTTSVTTTTSTSTSTSTTTGVSTSTGLDTGSTDAGFITDPDVGSCGPQPDGTWDCSWCHPAFVSCPEGEKCAPELSGGYLSTTQCVTVPGDGAAVGEACSVMGIPLSGYDDCAAGAMCWDLAPGTLDGTCVEFCYEGDPTACAAGEVCMSSSLFSPYVCMTRCDPFDPVECGVDEVCRGIGLELVCVPSGVLPQGLWCEAEDMFCTEAEFCAFSGNQQGCAETRCCTSWCDLSAADPDAACAAEEPAHVCRPFSHPVEPPAGYEHVGHCGLPV